MATIITLLFILPMVHFLWTGGSHIIATLVALFGISFALSLIGDISEDERPLAAFWKNMANFIVLPVLILFVIVELFSDKPSYTPSTDIYRQSYNDYECVGDCSGHEAGYEWARDNSIKSPSDCETGNSSFDEGCASGVEVNQGVDSWYRE